MIKKEVKNNLIKKFARSAQDVGSSEVQVALFSEQIRSIADHLKTHAKDHSSARGLLLLVGQRRTLLNYLQRSDRGRYDMLMKNLHDGGYL
jgi:small subunit ribosomal protein S15